jgi:peptide deformylase
MYTQTQPQKYTESVDTTTEERDSDEDENYNENRRFSTFNVEQYQQQQDLSTGNNGVLSVPNLSGKIAREKLRPLNIIRNKKYIHIHYRLVIKRLNPREKCSNCSSEMRSTQCIYYQLIHKPKNF